MRTVVTTPIPGEVLGELKDPFFLGPWCWPKARLGNLWDNSEISKSTLSHPWEQIDRKRLDMATFDQSYFEVMSEIADFLNDYHGEVQTRRFWEIIVGPWLSMYGFILFEKFTLLQHLDHVVASPVEVLDSADELGPPADMHEFKDLFLDDRYMSRATADMAEALGISIRLEDLKFDSGAKPKPRARHHDNFKLLRLGLTKLARNTDVVMFETFQNPSVDAAWQLRLGQVPMFWSFPRPPQFTGPLNLPTRLKGEAKGPKVASFSKILFMLAVRNIPICYLEGFSQTREFTEKLGLPAKPKWILTSNAYFKNETFKFYVAQRSAEGCPYLISQHGGGFGVNAFNIHQDHILRVADAFFTWGWKSGSRTYPASVVKPLGKILPSISGDILLIEYAGPPYVNEKSSIPLGEVGWQRYWEDQIEFFSGLDPEVQARVRVRLHPGDFGRDIGQQWINNFPNIRFDDPNVPLRNSLKSCAMAIVTYDSTTYLQLLQAKFPFTSFWRPSDWMQNEEASRLFGDLIDAGVFHSEPLQASKFVNTHLKDPIALGKLISFASASPFAARFASETPKLRVAVRKWVQSNKNSFPS